MTSLNHGVGRVLSFFSSRLNWDSPNHSPAGKCAPLPLVPGWGGGGQPFCRERGWESPNTDEGTNTVVLYICVYFVGEQKTTLMASSSSLATNSSGFFSG
jgi:hypothetical protein